MIMTTYFNWDFNIFEILNKYRYVISIIDHNNLITSNPLLNYLFVKKWANNILKEAFKKTVWIWIYDWNVSKEKGDI